MTVNTQILIIDNDDSFLRSARHLLHECGEIITTSDFKAVPNFLAIQPIRMIVIDVWMNPTNGGAILQFIRGNFPEIPVIVVTAFASKEMVIEAANLHVFAILEKPLNEDVFLSTVKRAIRHNAPYSAPIEVALDSEELSVRLGGVKTYLTHTEFQLLSAFTSNRGKRVAREDLVSMVWARPRSFRTFSIPISAI